MKDGWCFCNNCCSHTQSCSLFHTTVVLGCCTKNFYLIGGLTTEIQLIKGRCCFRHIHTPPPWRRATANNAEPGGVNVEEDSGGAGEQWERYKELAVVHCTMYVHHRISILRRRALPCTVPPVWLELPDHIASVANYCKFWFLARIT